MVAQESTAHGRGAAALRTSEVIRAAGEFRYPQRFREAEARNRRLGRPLQLVTRQWVADPVVMDTIGRRLLERDEVGASVVRAMRTKDRAHPDKVTMGQFQRALDGGVETVPDAPQPLVDFFAVVDNTPAWVDFDLVNEGAQAFRQFGQNSADVLLQLALIGSYRFGGPTDLLVATGGLTGDTTTRRLAETQHWAVALAGQDAMRRNGAGFRLTVHVRLMHALVNHQFEANGRWDTDRWGLPINQSDQAATLGLFSGALLLGVRMLGVRVSRAESRAVMHLWKYVGWLMGVDEDWLCDTEMQQHRLNYHHLITQSHVSAAGPPLANAVVDAQATLHYGRFAQLQGKCARLRLLSMLRFFLRKQGMRELDLPWALPWALPPILVANLIRYHLVARTPVGRRYLQRWGERSAHKRLRQYFGNDALDVGTLTV